MKTEEKANKNNDLSKLNLAANTSRNLGLYKAQRTYDQLQALLASCLLEFDKPGVYHVRIRPSSPATMAEGVSYLRNLFTRKGIRYGWVKATEADPDQKGLHLHLFIVMETANRRSCEELKEALWGFYRNGYCHSFHLVQPKQPGEPGQDWIELETPFLPLTAATLPDAVYWMSYALKQRSKDTVLKIGKRPVLFRFPIPKPRGIRKASSLSVGAA